VPTIIWDRPATTILSSRGCPYDCVYCSCPTFSNRRCRSRSAENVLKEIEEINKQGYGSFSFVDDNFLLDINRATEICDGMISSRYSIKWACEGRTDPKVSGIFKTLSAAGCDVVMFGIESGSQRILDSISKKTKLSNIEEVITSATKAGIAIRHGFFLVGLPGETVEDVKLTFDFAERLEINTFGFNVLTAFRGTALWNDAVAEGYIDEDKNWDKILQANEISPDAIDFETLTEIRSKFIKRLIWRKISRHPIQATKLFKRFLICMSVRDVFRLFSS
jgi:radical SAM superfamily enzyme YgiQ (UPF0313 family)